MEERGDSEEKTGTTPVTILAGKNATIISKNKSSMNTQRMNEMIGKLNNLTVSGTNTSLELIRDLSGHITGPLSHTRL